jgi:chromosome segregation ATPase
MKNYRIEMMTKEEYDKYMMGALFVNIDERIVTAETKEEAIAVAETNYPNMVINKNYVLTLEEYEAERKAEETERAERRAEEEERNRKANETKARNEAKRAEEMGKTLEEYKAYKKAESNMKRYAREVERLEKELAYNKAKMEEWKAKMI